MTYQTTMSALMFLSIVLVIYEIIIFVKWNKYCQKIWSKYFQKWVNSKPELKQEIKKLDEKQICKAKREIKIRLIFNFIVLAIAIIGVIVFGVLSFNG
ncbi:hypothetical protein [Spiroplasma chrysopicola]|uniref:Uncharacterized protein n=1 Tax=Spiroplasma chrysopicola DF-1 TaxID=1276227 RepID=R4UB93_9MOLU|nr:hypothetical protein [Spiroplasma chrysopicola]AGM25144.1 hypothetical protein SCHRY_v1c05660 [Spiroplasma chrysopicola DF-1]